MAEPVQVVLLGVRFFKKNFRGRWMDGIQPKDWRVKAWKIYLWFPTLKDDLSWIYPPSSESGKWKSSSGSPNLKNKGWTQYLPNTWASSKMWGTSIGCLYVHFMACSPSHSCPADLVHFREMWKSGFVLESNGNNMEIGWTFQYPPWTKRNNKATPWQGFIQFW